MGPCAVTDAGSYITATSPKYILVRIDGRINASPIPGLPQDVFAIKPTLYTGYVRAKKGSGEPGRKFQVKQFPLTLAYAITDYKCQGICLSSLYIN
jgi:hypothetical protein